MRLQPHNPMRRAMIALLLLEMVAFGLAIPMLIQLTGIRPAFAAATAGGMAGFCLVCGGLFRTAAGYPLGWLAQLASLALGLVHPVLFFVAGIFVALYVLSFVLGRKIDSIQRSQGAGVH